MLCSDLTPMSLFNTNLHRLLIQSMTADLNLIETIDFIRNCQKAAQIITRINNFQHLTIKMRNFLGTHSHDLANVCIFSLEIIKSMKNRFIIPAQSYHFFCMVTKMCNNMHIWFLIPHINQINSQTQGQLISLWLNSCIG